jgi:hypothetical protein
VTAVFAAIGLIAGGPAYAAPSAYDEAFAKSFAETCIPGRLGYETTKATAEAVGWAKVAETDHAELAKVMAESRKQAADPELKATLDFVTYGRQIAGTRHHLVVARTSAVISEGSDPWVQVGCYLYNFDATTPVDPAPISAVLKTEVAASQDINGASSTVWGPPCPYARTGDTYLNFVSEGSVVATQIGFSGVALTFTTSEPKPGEIVPDSYC